MSSIRLDNCLFVPQHPRAEPIRITDDAPSSDESSPTSSPSRRLNPTSVTPAINVQARAPRRRAMRCFVPRPFPPPALANVPVEYIIDQLHTLAPHYWSKPETADCSIIVPLDGLFRNTAGQVPHKSGPATSDPFANLMPAATATPSSTGRRATDPIRPAPRMVMKLHMDYLSAHSTLLRGLFSGASPLDLIPSASSTPQTTPRGSFFQLPINTDRQPISPKPSAARGLPIAPLLPRLLPSSPSCPTIYLPVPDPASLRLLIHYMYFGSTTYIEDALDESTVTWEGLARNVEFLGMGTEIKVCLGRWYGRWRRGRSGRVPETKVEAEDGYSETDDDDSYVGSDEDDDDMMASSSVTTASVGYCDDEMDVENVLKRAELDAPRGREPTPRRLGHAASDPGPMGNQRCYSSPHSSQSSSPSPTGRDE